MQKSIIQITNVDNSAASTTDEDGKIAQATKYACENTNDYVFLLSENEVTRDAYGFASCNTSDTARRNKTTDYAQCQGAWTTSGNGWWWLRSPIDYSSYSARDVTLNGYANNGNGSGDVYFAGSGICPALWIKL